MTEAIGLNYKKNLFFSLSTARISNKQCKPRSVKDQESMNLMWGLGLFICSRKRGAMIVLISDVR